MSIPTPIPATLRPPAGAQTAHPMGLRPGMATSQDFVFQGFLTMPQPGEAGWPKKKGQERTGKAATITPFVGLINETGFVSKPTSVWQLLKSQKINMIWMNFCVWSSIVCHQLKRLLTQMSNQKRKGKAPADPCTAPGVVGSIAVDGNTQFLSMIMGADKAFRILCSVKVGSLNMNVISTAMMRRTGTPAPLTIGYWICRPHFENSRTERRKRLGSGRLG